MPQYLVANYLPDDFDPSAVSEAMIEEIHALNREMIVAGVRKFACGIANPAPLLVSAVPFPAYALYWFRSKNIWLPSFPPLRNTMTSAL